MSDDRIALTLNSSPLAQYLASIGLQDDLPQVELNPEDLPPIRIADRLSADEAAPPLPPPWSTANELLAQLQSLLLDAGLVPADEMSLLQLRRLATQAPPKTDDDSCTAPVREALLAEFEALCKREVQRHELLFVFVRRVEELEQLERGYRFHATASAVPFATTPPSSSSSYTSSLQRSALFALRSCATELHKACSLLAGVTAPRWQHLMPAPRPLTLDSEAPSAHILRQYARDLCGLRTDWLYHMLALAATNPFVLRKEWSIVSVPTNAIEELKGILDLETYLEALRRRNQPKAPTHKPPLLRDLSLLRHQLRSMVALTAAAEETATALPALAPRIARLNEELAYAGALLVQIQTYLAPPAPKQPPPASAASGATVRSDAEVFEASGVNEAVASEEEEEEREEERVARMTTVAREMAALLTGKPSVYPPMPLDTQRSAKSLPTKLVTVAAESSEEVEAPPAPPSHLFAELCNVLTNRRATSAQKEEQFGSEDA